MKDLSSLKYFVRLEIAHSPTGLFVTQQKYTLDTISEVGFLGAKPLGTLIEQNHNLARSEGESFSEPKIGAPNFSFNLPYDNTS